MTPVMDRALLRAVRELVAARMGLNYPEEQETALVRGLAQAGQDLGFADPDR